jgi:hypothetical protein
VIHDKLQYMVIETLDRIHVLKNQNITFQRHKFINSKPSGENPMAGNALTTMRKRSTATKPEPQHRNVYANLEIPLLKWFDTRLGMDKTTAEREDLWVTFDSHFVNPMEKTPEKAFVWKH